VIFISTSELEEEKKIGVMFAPTPFRANFCFFVGGGAILARLKGFEMKLLVDVAGRGCERQRKEVLTRLKSSG
jgi:hypothetical protein